MTLVSYTLTSRMIMALTSAEKQRRYRERHLGVHGSKERIQLFVSVQDPARSGEGGCIGDIGTHAFQLAHFVVGVRPQSLLADLSTFVAGRRVDDNAQVLLRYANGARGSLWASQVAPGNENNLSLRVYGSKGGIEWHQEQPNHLYWSPFGEPTRLLSRAAAGLGATATRVSRIPAGHPEGYLE